MGALILWCALALSSVGWAQATGDNEAKQLYANGKMLFDEGRHEDALQAWQKAYELSERPLLLFNIALAQEKLGQVQTAIDTLYTYRIYAPPSEQDKLIAKIEELREKLENDQAEQVAPTPPVAEPETKTPPTQEPPTPEPTPAEEGFALSTEAIIAWSVAGASTVGGLSFGLMSNKQSKIVDQYCSNGSNQNVCRPQVGNAASKQKGFAIAADISWGLSLAATGTAIWLTVRDAKQTSGAMTPTLFWSGSGAGLRGQF